VKHGEKELRSREREIVESLRILEQDRDDGLVDEHAYVHTRLRYEHERDELVSRLQVLEKVAITERQRRKPERSTRRRWRLQAAGAGVMCLAALLVFLVAALHTRGQGETITGAIAGGAGATAPQAALDLQGAQQAVYRHPRSYAALVNLGTAYLQSGRVMEADLSFQSAMRVAPSRAAAPTFHAMLLGAVKRYSQALLLLRKVERDHPTYSRAWLMDGILSSHVKGGKERAVASWLRFLMLEPRSSLAGKVQSWIRREQRKR
jgi:cytochrome c-type biogenesis protein CcmH/NrfG